MLIRLSRALLRVFPAILLVVLGLLAALFRSRRGPRKGATTLVPTPARQTVPPVRRRWAAIALLGLLLGVGLILTALQDDGTLRRLVSPLPSSDGNGRRPVAAMSKADADIGGEKTSDAVAPGRSGEHGVATASRTPGPNAPTFDTVRVEPNGELVVAGRATPNSTVELLVDGRSTAKAVADANGQFAIVPPALPAGTSEIALRATDAGDFVRQSRDSVAVVVSPSGDAKPLVALTSPDKPTVVLSQPGSSSTAYRSIPEATPDRRTMAGFQSQRGSGEVTSSRIAETGDVRPSRTGSGAGAGGSDEAKTKTMPGRAESGSPSVSEVPPSRGTVVAGAEGAPPKIVSVDAQEGGRLFVTGQAVAGATVRLYLNDTLIAPARVRRDGTVSFAIGRGVKPGDYKVRLDQIDAASGKVRSRVEVPFSVPDVVRIARADRSVAAPVDMSPNTDESGRVASNASQPMASSPETVPRRGRAAGASDGPQDSLSGKPAAPVSSETRRDPPEPKADPAVVFVPEVKTARIERGDSLWAISRRTYGEGDRYTAIYDANQDQIRDPDLIYPGQVFVLPSEEAIDAVRDEKNG